MYLNIKNLNLNVHQLYLYLLLCHYSESHMTVNLVIGTQWGDEGKGKIVDYFSKNADYVVRFNGGNNAGHTIKIGEEVYKLHLTPSGVIQGKIGVIGNGVVIDPQILINEIEELTKRGIKPKLLISDRANIIMPYHKILDGAEENFLGDKKIGTTKKGIGPCYSDKTARYGIRAIDLLDREALSTKLDVIINIKQRIFNAYDIDTKLDKKELLETYLNYGKRLKSFITTTHIELNNAIKSGKNILLEGAQGTMLDVDYGTYPYTTSSNTIAGESSIGSGIGPHSVNEIIGIVKAYTTRVGNGPFPTELLDADGEKLRKIGVEYGATTGRPRRCGWFDAFLVNYSVMINGIDEVAITKLDVLSDFSEIKVCTGYQQDGKILKSFPTDFERLQTITPVYETLKGWNKDISNCRSYDDLPNQTKEYLDFISKQAGMKIKIVSVGPKRDQTFFMN